MRPGEAGNALLAAEQARKPADLAVHILLAALDDQPARDVGGDDLGARIAGCAQHAHRVIMREHDMLDRLVGDLRDARDHVLRHLRRRLRVDDQSAVGPDHHAGIRIALGGVAVEALAEFVEADDLVGEILGAGEAGHRCLPAGSGAWPANLSNFAEALTQIA